MTQKLQIEQIARRYYHVDNVVVTYATMQEMGRMVYIDVPNDMRIDHFMNDLREMRAEIPFLINEHLRDEWIMPRR